MEGGEGGGCQKTHQNSEGYFSLLQCLLVVCFNSVKGFLKYLQVSSSIVHSLPNKLQIRCTNWWSKLNLVYWITIASQKPTTKMNENSHVLQFYPSSFKCMNFNSKKRESHVTESIMKDLQFFLIHSFSFTYYNIDYQLANTKISERKFLDSFSSQSQWRAKRNSVANPFVERYLSDYKIVAKRASVIACNQNSLKKLLTILL